MYLLARQARVAFHSLTFVSASPALRLNKLVPMVASPCNSSLSLREKTKQKNESKLPWESLKGEAKRRRKLAEKRQKSVAFGFGCFMNFYAKQIYFCFQFQLLGAQPCWFALHQ